MAKTIKLTLSEDEVEILIDALEADMEGYLEAAKEARGNNNRADVQTFTEAAERIQAMLAKLQALLE
jgi:cell division septum initiation protein DivIVA